MNSGFYKCVYFIGQFNGNGGLRYLTISSRRLCLKYSINIMSKVFLNKIKRNSFSDACLLQTEKRSRLNSVQTPDTEGRLHYLKSKRTWLFQMAVCVIFRRAIISLIPPAP